MDTASLPKTRAEAKATGAKYYFTGEPCKHGHVAPRKTKGACVECLKVEWEKGNTSRAEYFRQYNQSDAGKQAKQKYYIRNKDQVMAKAQSRSPEERRFHKRTYKLKHPDLYRAFNKSRRKKHRNATPKWLTKDHKRAIRQLYIDAMTVSRITGTPYVVDHIIPLNGENVSGLHVPWNLRVITREENLVKSNKVVDTPLDGAYTGGDSGENQVWQTDPADDMQTAALTRM